MLATQLAEQQHQLGRYAIELPGIPTDLAFDTMRLYGVRPTPEQHQQQRDGDGYTRDPMNPNGASWQVHCPDNYAPDQAFGVLVFIHAADSGRLYPHVAELLAEYRLIAIGADHEGNKHNPVYRHAAALQGLALLRERYTIDEDRVYVHGISGGGRMTSQVALMNADDFDGAVCIVGCNPYKNIPADKGPNTVYRGFWRNPDRALLKLARERNRLVLHTGEHDGNRHNTLQVHKAYERDGFQHLLYLEEPGLGHEFASQPAFKRALDFLDAPVFADAEPAYGRAQRFEAAERWGDALLNYRSAARHHRGQAWADDAQAEFQNLQARYDQELEETQAMFTAGVARHDVVTAVNKFARLWGEAGTRDVRAMRETLRDMKQR